MSTKRTLKEILLSPIEENVRSYGDLTNLLSEAIHDWKAAETERTSWRIAATGSQQLKSSLKELVLLADFLDSNAPAPDVNAALMANEECQEILAEVKTQNAGLLSACKSARDYIGKRAGSAWGLMTYTELDVSITNAETPQRPAHAELRRFFAEVSPQPLTAREEMERETA